MQDHDKLWIVLPTRIWRKLFSLAIQANMSANEYLQTIIEQETQEQEEIEAPDSPQDDQH
ncbi:MAG: hypothetical protein ACOYYS_06115 [Chloroflexota bacterium]